MPAMLINSTMEQRSFSHNASPGSLRNVVHSARNKLALAGIEELYLVADSEIINAKRGVNGLTVECNGCCMRVNGCSRWHHWHSHYVDMSTHWDRGHMKRREVADDSDRVTQQVVVVIKHSSTILRAQDCEVLDKGV